MNNTFRWKIRSILRVDLNQTKLNSNKTYSLQKQENKYSQISQNLQLFLYEVRELTVTSTKVIWNIFIKFSAEHKRAFSPSRFYLLAVASGNASRFSPPSTNATANERSRKLWALLRLWCVLSLSPDSWGFLWFSLFPVCRATEDLPDLVTCLWYISLRYITITHPTFIPPLFAPLKASMLQWRPLIPPPPKSNRSCWKKKTRYKRDKKGGKTERKKKHAGIGKQDLIKRRLRIKFHVFFLLCVASRFYQIAKKQKFHV